jgi:intraflagellar transport protein 172
LILHDLERHVSQTLINFCTFVSWVPQSDVIVAQSQGSLCVWYNPNQSSAFTIIPIKGQIEAIERQQGSIRVVLDEGSIKNYIELDRRQIDFNTSIQDRDYGRALDLLESLDINSVETESLWRTLGQMALQENQLHVAEQCFAVIGDVCTAQYLQKVNSMCEAAKLRNPMACSITIL